MVGEVLVEVLVVVAVLLQALRIVTLVAPMAVLLIKFRRFIFEQFKRKNLE
jgi:hypothetical protein